jgi:hypothetical protein
MRTSLPDPVIFESNGLTCRIEMIPGKWFACVAIPKEHPLYRRRRDVEVAIPHTLAGRNVDHTRVAWADVGGVAKLPAVLEAGVSVPASILLDCPGGIMFTGMLSDFSGKWWIGFMTPPDTSQDEVRTELVSFAQIIDALADVVVTGGPAAYPELPTV